MIRRYALGSADGPTGWWRDVGFGKRSRLRAAFVAGGKQVAVISCPTTCFAKTGQTFCDRFADWLVKVAELSRFNTAKESALPLKELWRKIDIIIGTHAD